MLTVPVGFSFADTRYVSDRLIISVRDGQGKDDAVLGYIKTGTSVDVLEEKKGYLRIKSENGLEGWVQVQYIISERPNSLLVEDLKSEINGLNKKIERFESNRGPLIEKSSSINESDEAKIRELEQALSESQQMVSQAKKELVQMNEKYQNLPGKSKTAVEMIRELKKLKKLNKELKTKINSIDKHNKNPFKSIYIQWFLYGAGVLLFGFMIGRSAKKQRKPSLF